MAITLTQYIKELKKTLKDTPKWAFDNMLLIAKQNAVAVIAERVRTTGQKATGGGFKPYSTKDTFIGAKSFTTKGAANKVLGSKRKRSKLKWITTKDGNHIAVLEGGYKKIREIEGRNTSFKDFERTGEMWRKFGIVSVKKKKTNIRIRIGGQSQSAANKITWNSELENESIIAISNKEEKQLLNIMEEDMFKFFEKRV